MTLLQSALKLQKKMFYTERRSRYSDQEVELALAWLEGKINHGAMRGAAKLPVGSGSYAFLAVALRAAYRRGLIQIKRVSPKERQQIQ
jgi:hypothetical protein